ncbi:MAG: ferric iron uptake transcriptional regulator [Thiotrichales bacterium 32-46-8]|nr:ferric iron uptake transcriptional regulator [Gammaproteobacteria bacterium]OYX06774.1 MAG: ferric iron uptake transcriptional regulator [Thiotrichales bacterium 32-46-8]OYZ07406.1 MAG: ferric iron uptake transcriptional regulator [Thiotrichales bacterium 16-46-22]OZA18446.1 MAG: ferric iron uptake transcriptional regulator [Thiotrichales bacterium 17-46-47]OZA97105.1 MAG: ferric iron uptake transcriptional regulator [Thiotrichales bacterium 34-46-19]UCG18790.1 MAG: ferric iron uptake trans
MKQTADLRKAGLKVTLPRVKILEILESAGDQHHLTAEDVYKVLLEQDEEVGLATVYRVLTQFEAAGIVRRLNFENNISTFELDTGDNHDHIVCLQSGMVEEFVDPIIESRIKAIADERGYELSWHSLTIYGSKKSQD